MKSLTPAFKSGQGQTPTNLIRTQRLALDEYELATRWGLSVKTLQRWRQQSLGPVFCKLGARVTYLIPEVEAFERRVSRNSTSARAYL